MKHLPFSIFLLFFATTSIIYPKPGIAQERDALDLVLSENDKALVEDIIETSQNISEESQDKLQEIMENWDKLQKDYPNLPENVRNKIDEINRGNLKGQIEGFTAQFKLFDAGLKKLLDIKEKADQVIYFYDRYKPDSQNPFRSLEVMTNIFTDVEKLLPKEVKYEYFRKPTVWLVRVGIDYYKTAIGNSLDGLRNIQKQIKDRAGNCIGYVGGDGTADRSDPKRKAFTDLNTGDIICYTGIRPIGGEIWSNTNGDGVLIWSNDKWTKLNCGLGLVNDIFTEYKLANGTVLTEERMIYWCNKELAFYKNLKSAGQSQFDLLYPLVNSDPRDCKYILLFLRDKHNELRDFMSAFNNDKKLFVAKYVFNKDDIINKASVFARIVLGTVLFEGKVKDNNGNPIANASISIKTNNIEKTTYTSEYGVFEMLAEIPEKSQIGSPFKIKISANGYKDYETASKIYDQCMSTDLVTLDNIGQLVITPVESIIKIGETVEFTVLFSDGTNDKDVTSEALTNSTFKGISEGSFSIQAFYGNYATTATIDVEKENKCPNSNEIWDNNINDCRCIDGYEKNVNGECVKIVEVSEEVICTDPNSEKIWDEVLQKYVCNCIENFTFDPNTGLCVLNTNELLNNADCANVADAVAKWDPISQGVICSCTKNYYLWDAGQKKCVPDVQAILNNSDCSQWPNTEAKWDFSAGEPYCDCKAGYEWNENYTKCISLQEKMVSQTDCSQYGNAYAVWDPVRNEVACDCLPGYEWDENYTKCISIALAGMQNYDCSGYPNTEVVWDPVSEQAWCDCLPGYEWNDDFTGCEPPLQQQPQQPVQYDCSHLPNSRPVFDQVLNETVCDCMPGFEWNRDFTACVPVRNKPNIDWGNIISMTNDILNGINAGNSGMFPTGASSLTQGTSMQQPVQHQSNCNDQQQAGANTPEVHNIDLGQSFGSFKFDYETFTAKDQIVITNGGRTIFNSGCVGERKSIQLNLSGFSPTISVRVNPNCDGGSSTQWNFTVHCPQN